MCALFTHTHNTVRLLQYAIFTTQTQFEHLYLRHELTIVDLYVDKLKHYTITEQIKHNFFFAFFGVENVKFFNYSHYALTQHNVSLKISQL